MHQQDLYAVCVSDAGLRYFDKLVESEGYGSVVLEDVMKSAAKQ